MIKSYLAFALIFTTLCSPSISYGVPVAALARETVEIISAKIPTLVGKQTIEKTTEATLKYGDEVLPLLKSIGPAGFKALEDTGKATDAIKLFARIGPARYKALEDAGKATDAIKLFARKGDEAIWIISEPKKLTIFLKHGDSAADALLKHPGIADDLITRFGADAVGALNSVSKQGAQRLGMLEIDGVLTATPLSKELLPVIAKYGDSAMEFIWRNKGALVVTAGLATFLKDPQIYIQGLKDLIVDPMLKPIVESTNWTLIIAGGLLIIFLPFAARSFARARLAMRSKGV